MSAKDKNAAAESRCKSYFSMKKLHHLLKHCPRCWPLRKGIYQFFYEVFLEVDEVIFVINVEIRK
jgi:hypothetical protein